MSRRRLLRAVLLLGVALAGALLLPDVRWQAWGRLRGEAFYKNRPTSYWRGRMVAWNDIGFYPPAVSLVVRRPRWWVECVPWSRGWLAPAPADAEEPFPDDDPAAVLVLRELLRDQDPEVRAEAAKALRRIDPQAAAEAGVP